MRLISYKPQFTPWSSFDRVNSVRDLFDSALGLESSRSVSGRRWAPPLDIREDASQVVVKVELAGLKKEDFEISLHDDNLTISGQRDGKTEKSEGKNVRSERIFGRFSRTVTLPSAVQGDGVRATYVDGVLTVVLPKVAEVQPRKIEVNVI